MEKIAENLLLDKFLRRAGIVHLKNLFLLNKKAGPYGPAYGFFKGWT